MAPRAASSQVARREHGIGQTPVVRAVTCGYGGILPCYPVIVRELLPAFEAGRRTGIVLLFAGAVHIDLEELAQRKWAIGIMATLGVMTSTFLMGGMMYFLMQMVGTPIPFIWALVFGALISPTDPVAVLGLLKTVKIPPLLKAKVAGESLFNDGVGVVVFTIMVAIATGGGGHGEGELAVLAVVDEGDLRTAVAVGVAAAPGPAIPVPDDAVEELVRGQFAQR